MDDHFVGKVHKVEIPPCRICGEQNNGATGIDTNRTPEPGDLSICIACGAVGVYTKDGGLRAPTDAERESLPDEALNAIAFIRLNKGARVIEA